MQDHLSVTDLKKRMSDEEVTCFNPEYHSDRMTMGELLRRVEQVKISNSSGRPIRALFALILTHPSLNG